jgi:hypothetical protein
VDDVLDKVMARENESDDSLLLAQTLARLPIMGDEIGFDKLSDRAHAVKGEGALTGMLSC